MIVQCAECRRSYDDSACWTVCPHGPLWAPNEKYCAEHHLVNCPFHATGKRAIPTAQAINLGQIDATDADRLIADPAENVVELRDGTGKRYLANVRQQVGAVLQVELVGVIVADRVMEVTR